MTYEKFIRKYGLTAVFTPKGRSAMTQGNRFDVRIARGEESAHFEFHDSAHNAQQGKRSDLADVLQCLATDASVAEDCMSVDDVAETFGITVPSEAIRIFEGCRETQDKLKNLLGPALYETLLYETEEA